VYANNNDNNNNNNNDEGGFFDGLSKWADSITGGMTTPGATDMEPSVTGIAATATDAYSEGISQIVDNADGSLSPAEYLAGIASTQFVNPSEEARVSQSSLFDDGVTKSWTGSQYNMVSNAPTDVFITPIAGAGETATTATTTAAMSAVAAQASTASAAMETTTNSFMSSPSNTIIMDASSSELVEKANKLSIHMESVISEVNSVLAGNALSSSELLSEMADTALEDLTAVATTTTPTSVSVASQVMAATTASLGDSAQPVVVAAAAAADTASNIADVAETVPQTTADASDAAFDATASAVESASTATSDLASQLSGLTYDSFTSTTEKVAKASATRVAQTQSPPPPVAVQEPVNPFSWATDTVDQVSSSAEKVVTRAATSSSSGPNPLNKFMADAASNASDSLHSVQDGITAQATAQVTGFNNAVGQVSAAIPRAMEASKGKVVEQGNAISAQSVKLVSGVAAGSTAAVQGVGEKSIADLASDVIGGLQYVGHAMENGINIVLSQIDYEHDTTVASLIQGAQNSVHDAIQGAIDSVMTTIHNIGNLTLQELILSFIQLLTTLVKFVYVILSAVIQTVSGRGLDEWTIATMNAVNHQASTLTAQASQAAYDATHTSLADLGSHVGTFSHDVGQLIVQTIGIVGTLETPGAGQIADIATLAGTM